MKLILLGCLLASAYSTNLEALAGPQVGPQGQYFERTPNNNLVQIKYIGAGSGLNNAAINSQSQSQGLNQINQQNQGLNQFSQVFSQGNQNLNQQNQVVAQFAQQNQGFSVNTEPFSFSNHKFANPNLVEVSFDENRHQQFIANQERERQQFQTQTKQGQHFQNRQIQTQQQQQQQNRQQQQQLQRQQPQQQQIQQQQQQQQQRQQLQQQQQQRQQQQQQQQQIQQQQQQKRQQQQTQQQQRQQQQQQQQQRVQHLQRQPSFFQGHHQNPINQIIKNQGIRHFQNQFPQQPIRTPMREIAGHLQRVDSDEIIGIFQPFTIPVSASLFEGNVNSQFSCASEGQGFYADPLNNCQQFHVCTKVLGRNTPDLYRFTFQCANGEYFDQSALTCLRLAGPSSGSCAASTSVYPNTKTRARHLFSDFGFTPYTPGATPPGICYLANNAHFVTGIRRK